MSCPNNQDIEEYYFERFRRHYKVPDGELMYTDKPDVIIRGSKIIGIEITNLYLTSGANPANEQVQRSRRLHTLAHAQELHLSAGGKSIELSVDFDPELADLAKAIENNQPGGVNPRMFRHIPQLRFVYNNSREYVDPQWRPVPVYDVSSLSVHRLREVIKQKGEKIVEYQSCDEYWLLVVIDFFDPAQDQEIECPLNERLEESPFRHIIL